MALSSYSESISISDPLPVIQICYITQSDKRSPLRPTALPIFLPPVTCKRNIASDPKTKNTSVKQTTVSLMIGQTSRVRTQHIWAKPAEMGGQQVRTCDKAPGTDIRRIQLMISHDLTLVRGQRSPPALPQRFSSWGRGAESQASPAEGPTIAVYSCSAQTLTAA